MLIKSDFISVLSMIVRHELDKHSLHEYEFNRNGSITLPGVFAEISLYAQYKRKDIAKLVYMIFCGNVSAFYTDKIWTKDDIKKDVTQIPTSDWINTSNHDSCWTSDGMKLLERDFFDMCEEIAPGIAPARVHFEAKLGDILWRYPKPLLVTIRNMNTGRELLQVQHIK